MTVPPSSVLNHEQVLKDVFIVIPRQLLQAAALITDSEGLQATIDAYIAGLTGVFGAEVAKQLPSRSRADEMLQYLLHCCQRADGYKTTADTLPVITAIKSSLMRHIVFLGALHSELLEKPFVALPNLIFNALGSRDTRDYRACSTEVLEALVAELAGADGGSQLDSFMRPLLFQVHSESSKGKLNFETVNQVLGPLTRLCHLPEARDVLLANQMWVLQRDAEGRLQEQGTILGPLMCMSCFPDSHPEAPSFYFGSERQLQPSPEAAAIMLRLQTSTTFFQSALTDLFLTLLRHKKETRPRVLDYFSHFVKTNAKRGQLQNMHVPGPGWGSYACNGFSFNVFGVLLNLFRPFLTQNDFSKIDDGYLFRSYSRLDVSEDNRIGEHDEDALQGWLKDSPPLTSEPHFASDSFFLTLGALHVGLVPNITKFKEQFFGRQGYVRQVQMLQQRAQMAAALQGQVAKIGREMCCYFTHFLDEGFVSRVLSFLGFTARWLLKVAKADSKDWKPSDIALESLTLYTALPEWILDDMIEFLLFQADRAPKLLDACPSDVAVALSRLCVICSSSAKITKNPYLRSKMVEFMAKLAPELRQDHLVGHSAFFSTLCLDSVSVNHLSAALMQFYVDIEDTDPYSRYNRRYFASVMLKNVASLPVHRSTILASSRATSFLRFVMLLINDSTYLMDESRELLDKIANLTARLADLREGSREAMQARGELTQHEGHCKAVVLFAKESIQMLCHMTLDVIEPFLRDEIVDRLVGMLNYNLNALMSLPHKIEEYKARGFEPSELLTQLADIYLQLSGLVGTGDFDATPFFSAIVRDGRSYSRELFEKAVYVLGSISRQRSTRFSELLAKVTTAEAQMSHTDEVLGDIPDEFLDPILATLMKDPVILPSSRNIVDRAMIVQHLLSDPTDPFNRDPLTVDDLIPATDMKERIEAWVKEQRSK